MRVTIVRNPYDAVSLGAVGAKREGYSFTRNQTSGLFIEVAGATINRRFCNNTRQNAMNPKIWMKSTTRK